MGLFNGKWIRFRHATNENGSDYFRSFSPRLSFRRELIITSGLHGGIMFVFLLSWVWNVQ